jgi:hypothetical protein
MTIEFGVFSIRSILEIRSNNGIKVSEKQKENTSGTLNQMISQTINRFSCMFGGK